MAVSKMCSWCHSDGEINRILISVVIWPWQSLSISRNKSNVNRPSVNAMASWRQGSSHSPPGSQQSGCRFEAGLRQPASTRTSPSLVLSTRHNDPVVPHYTTSLTSCSFWNENNALFSICTSTGTAKHVISHCALCIETYTHIYIQFILKFGAIYPSSLGYLGGLRAL